MLTSLPFDYILAAVSGIAAVVAGWLYARFSRAAGADEQRRDLQRALPDTAFTALLVFVVAWKLSPLVSTPATVVAAPIALLYLPGGSIGTLLGVTAAGVWTVWRRWPRLRDSGAAGQQFKKGLGVMLAAGLLILIPGQRLQNLDLGTAGSNSPDSANSTANAAPGFTLESLSGERVALQDLQGTPVVLNFWATWCPPCRAEFPELVALQQEFGDTVRVVGINLTQSERSIGDVREFTARYEPGFMHLLDTEGQVQALYGVSAVPTTYILDAEGAIVQRRVGAVSASLLRGYLQPLLQ